MNILIVTGGNIEIDFALDFLKEKKFDEIIAVDGALSFFDKVGEKIKKVGCFLFSDSQGWEKAP